MITPRFKLSQTDGEVSIQIRAPYSSLKELEVEVNDETFIFYSRPYYLRLTLPGRLVENDFAKSTFDADSGEFTFTFQKANEGEFFPDLDLITKLLAPNIKVGSSENAESPIVIITNEHPQKIQADLNEEFGFALAGKSNFHHVSAEFDDVFEVNPTEMKLSERHKLRLQLEQGKFNMDHYLSDYIENEEILEIINLTAPWTNLSKDTIEFTDAELDFLKDLPNIQHNLSDAQVNYCHCSLLDILFAYCYDRRTTQFEGTSESGWTVIKLAASFCWLDVFKDPKEAVVCAFRRSVIFPLYRNFALSQAIFADLKQILALGEKYIIKCLIEMHEIFMKGDCCRYIINNLFIKDYIIYIMKWDKKKWSEIVLKVNSMAIQKADLGLNLAEIEEDICKKLGNLSNLVIKDDDSDDSEYYSDSSSDTDQTSSNSSSE